MADRAFGERVLALEIELQHMKADLADIIESRKSRAGREWTLIMSVVSVLIAFIANKLGLIG